MSGCLEFRKEYQPTSVIYEYILRGDQNNGLQTWFAGGICQCQQNWRGEHHFCEEGPSAIYTHVEMEGLHNDVNEYLMHSLPEDSRVISTNYNKRQVLSRLRAIHDFSHFDILLTSTTQPLSKTCHPKICQQTWMCKMMAALQKLFFFLFTETRIPDRAGLTY